MRRFIPARAGNASATLPAATGSGGSSPRVRGTHRRLQHQRHSRPVHPRACGERIAGCSISADARRFIPARAGNAPHRIEDKATQPVHPRACGERHRQPSTNTLPLTVHPRACGERPVSRQLRMTCGNGSSPRVRGTPAIRWPDGIDHSRFIPARAGNAPADIRRRRTHRGSSPRVRGTLAKAVHARQHAAVHPRACGERRPAPREELVVLRFIPARAGNAPPMPVIPLAGRRFIPARAGNAAGQCIGDRVRLRFIPARAGNAVEARAVYLRSCGSSPRVRGTRRSRRSAKRMGTVHPRACGERTMTASCRRCFVRFIPARAGNAGVRAVNMPTRRGSSPRVRGTRERYRSAACR